MSDYATQEVARVLAESKDLVAKGLKKHCSGAGCRLNQGGTCRVGNGCPLATAAHKRAILKTNPFAAQLYNNQRLQQEIATSVDGGDI